MAVQTVLGLIFLAAAATAFDAADVTDVDVSVKYESPGPTFTISLTNLVSDGVMQLQPGTFTVEVIAKNTGGTTIFLGESDPVTINGGETAPISLTIILLDQEQFAAGVIDASIDYDPIIVSIVVDPTVVKIGNETTIRIGAIDPAQGVDVASYTFQIPEGNGAHDGGSSCSGNSCNVTYKAEVNDTGTLEFTVNATDPTGNTDTITGFIGIDDTEDVNLITKFANRPFLDGITPTPSNGFATAVGETTTDLTLSIVLNDTDASDNLTLSATIWQLTTVGDSSLSFVSCSMDDVNITNNEDQAAGTAASLVWDPWVGVGDPSSYGETWCVLNLTVTDSYNLTSQITTYTIAAKPSATSGSSDLPSPPIITTVFVSDVTPANGDIVTVFVRYYDDDSGDQVQLDVKFGSASAAADFNQPSASCTSSSPCEATTSFTASGSGEIEIVATDSGTPTSTNTMKKTITLESRRRSVKLFRRESASGTARFTDITISQGQLSAKLTRTLADRESSNPEEESPVDPTDKGEEPSSSVTSMIAIGAGAGVAVLAALVVAVAVVKRRTSTQSKATKDPQVGTTIHDLRDLEYLNVAAADSASN